MQKLGFLKPGQTVEEAKRSTSDKSGGITIVKSAYIGSKFKQGYIAIRHPTLPFIAKCETNYGDNKKLLIEGFDIAYEPPNKNKG